MTTIEIPGPFLSADLAKWLTDQISFIFKVQPAIGSPSVNSYELQCNDVLEEYKI